MSAECFGNPLLEHSVLNGASTRFARSPRKETPSKETPSSIPPHPTIQKYSDNHAKAVVDTYFRQLLLFPKDVLQYSIIDYFFLGELILLLNTVADTRTFGWSAAPKPDAVQRLA